MVLVVRGGLLGMKGRRRGISAPESAAMTRCALQTHLHYRTPRQDRKASFNVHNAHVWRGGCESAPFSSALVLSVWLLST
jgi:hypothetical protein